MQELVIRQRNFFKTNTTKDISYRLEQLQVLERLLKENEPALYKAIYQDFKKSPYETFISELALLYQDIKEARRHLKTWARTKRVGTNVMNFPARSYIVPEPLGVCLIIGAWNYPYQLSFAPAIAAIAAGNTVILKPSELPKHTAAIMAKLIAQYFDSSFFTVVQGGVPETTELLEQKFDKIFFTGSTKVGKIVYAAAAKHLTPVTLELGGKSPAIVTANCNLSVTVKRLVWGKFLNAGQTCIAPDYVMVDQQVAEEFLQLAKKEISEAQYSFKNHNYLQIITTENFDRLEKLLNNGTLFHGGNTDRDTRYIEPTILTHITFEDAVMQEEIFGPILPVITFSHLQEAIDNINTLPKPLSCYIFTSDKKMEEQVVNNISFGGGAVNDTIMHITNSKLPFGGVGNSGMGSYHGEAGFKTFSHYKSLLRKPTWLEPPLKYSPYTASKLKWLKWLLKLQ